MKKFYLLLAVVFGAFIFWRFPSGPVLLPPTESANTPSYAFAESFSGEISILDENIQSVSHIEITPDGQYLLVGTLPGTIWVYHKTDQGFVRQKNPFFSVTTAQPGWPPQEAGVTGLALGADFETSGDVFVLYSFAFEKGSFRNRVMRMKFTKRGQEVIGSEAADIFEAATPGTGSHQIQDGIGVLVDGSPHLLFTVGEGFVASRALDPKEEAGKVMLIDRNGDTPAGERPFAQNGSVQALGIRNAPAIAQNPVSGKIAIADTGPSNFDRFIYGTLYDAGGKNNQELSFHWDGTEESLEESAADLYDGGKEMILYRWAPTETAVNIAWRNKDELLITLFGRTGEPGNDVGKKILLATLSEGTTNSLRFVPYIVRTSEELGHPLGLAVDPITHDVYFGDIIEGRVYQAKGGDMK